MPTSHTCYLTIPKFDSFVKLVNWYRNYFHKNRDWAALLIELDRFKKSEKRNPTYQTMKAIALSNNYPSNPIKKKVEKLLLKAADAGNLLARAYLIRNWFYYLDKTSDENKIRASEWIYSACESEIDWWLYHTFDSIVWSFKRIDDVEIHDADLIDALLYKPTEEFNVTPMLELTNDLHVSSLGISQIALMEYRDNLLQILNLQLTQQPFEDHIQYCPPKKIHPHWSYHIITDSEDHLKVKWDSWATGVQVLKFKTSDTKALLEYIESINESLRVFETTNTSTFQHISEMQPKGSPNATE
ncbi:hypothetical protein [Neptuniibacter sp. QD37_11]|uniref:hypothetical protein n=1 Tax=Neptuniibacter sp. QD37_11 TaxID=3398209 RepID=UPI0039F631DC